MEKTRQTRFSTRLITNLDMIPDDPPRRAATRRRWYLSYRPTVALRGGMKPEGDERRYWGKSGGNADGAECDDGDGVGFAVCITHGRAK